MKAKVAVKSKAWPVRRKVADPVVVPAVAPVPSEPAAVAEPEVHPSGDEVRALQAVLRGETLARGGGG